MKKFIAFKCFIGLYVFSWSLLFCAFKYSDFDKFQQTLSRQEVEAKIKTYLQHDSSLENFYVINDTSFSIFASPDDKKANKPEFVLRFGAKPKPEAIHFVPNLLSEFPLNGLRVVLDPGHQGGDIARIEERFIDMPDPDDSSRRIQFDEGTLATYTAKILKSFLVEFGADVLLTREEPGKPVCELSFAQWCEKEFGIVQDSDFLKPENTNKIYSHISEVPASLAATENLERRMSDLAKSASEEKIKLVKQALFRLWYNMFDLRARAEKINSFNPHVTIVIHYNAAEGDASSANYNLVFIPGSFLKDELSCEKDRYEFVRLIVCDDLDESLLLSKLIAKNMETGLSVPLMTSVFYQDNNAIYVDDGIYSRNLALTRLVHGPICYGETLIQNNPEEAKRLVQKDFDFSGDKISSRIVQVALAYFNGICEYFCVKKLINVDGF